MRLESCSECQSRGWVYVDHWGGTKDCPACNGTGRVKSEIERELDALKARLSALEAVVNESLTTEAEPDTPCPACGGNKTIAVYGDGRYMDRVTCPSCHGTEEKPT